MNTRNFGIATGRAVATLKIWNNQDGSRKIVLTLACQDNWKDEKGEYPVQYIDLEGFIRADKPTNGGFDYITKGTMITAEYSVRSNNWKDDKGETHHKQVLAIQSIDLISQPKNSQQNGQPYAQNGQPFVQNNQPVQNSQPYVQNGQSAYYPQNGQPVYYQQNNQPVQNSQPYAQNGQTVQNNQPYVQNGQPAYYQQNNQPVQNSQPYAQNGQPTQNSQTVQNGQTVVTDGATQLIP